MGSYIAQREKYLPKVLQLHESGMSYYKIAKIIPVTDVTIQRWIDKFATGKTNRPVQMKVKQPQQPSPAQDLQEIKSLQKRIKELEVELKRESLRADFYDEMINVAESKFNIPIRKKAGAKR